MSCAFPTVLLTFILYKITRSTLSNILKRRLRTNLLKCKRAEWDNSKQFVRGGRENFLVITSLLQDFKFPRP